VVPAPRDCPPLFPVFFKFNSALPQLDESAVSALVRWLLDHPETTLVVDGHSDSHGTAAANFELSRRRADEVVLRFTAQHLPRKRIARRAFGQYTPLVGLPELSAGNRRVDLSVQGAPDCPNPETP
jgi:OOP family OmpA-OmpF porin